MAVRGNRAECDHCEWKYRGLDAPKAYALHLAHEHGEVLKAEDVSEAMLTGLHIDQFRRGLSGNDRTFLQRRGISPQGLNPETDGDDQC